VSVNAFHEKAVGVKLVLDGSCGSPVFSQAEPPVAPPGVLLHTMAISGLSRVRTNLFPLLVIPSLTPHPVETNRKCRLSGEGTPQVKEPDFGCHKGCALLFRSGMATSYLITQTLGWPVLVSPTTIFAAVLFSLAVGVFFGFLPRS
jgi:hypothetical protein